MIAGSENKEEEVGVKSREFADLLPPSATWRITISNVKPAMCIFKNHV